MHNSGRLAVIARLAALLALCASTPPLLGQTPPTITSITAEPSGVTLEWTPSDPGQAYTLQVNPRLRGGLWTLAPLMQPWPIDALQVTLTTPAEDAAQFYRVLPVPQAERGRLISTQSLGTLATNIIASLFVLAGIDVTPEHDVGAYTFVYETIDPWGGRTTASGVLTLPQDSEQPLPLVSYQHGTVTEPTDVPSQNPGQRLPGIGFATTGYVTVMPDFLGLGDSPGFHPYHHARSEATAAIDLLRAARTWCATNNVELSGQLFLCGYSQGGHATMALHRELEAYYRTEFAVTASAPMAGAHDLSGVTLDDFLSGRPLPNPYYVAYLLAAYQDVYRLTNDWSNWLASPYDVTVPPLLESRAPGSEINDAMPSDITQLLKPEVLDALMADPDHPMRMALRDNDLISWVPQGPVRMFHCQGDMDVPYENSTTALASFHALGATHVELVDPNPPAGHGDCALPAFLGSKTWFDTFTP